MAPQSASLLFNSREARLTGHSNLMAKDDFKNLGFKEETKIEQKGGEGKGIKGELHW